MELEEIPIALKVSADEKYLAGEILESGDRVIEIISKDNKNVIQRITVDGLMLDFCFTTQNELQVLTSDDIVLYDIKNGKKISTIAYEKNLGEFVSVISGTLTKDGTKAVLDNHNSIYVINTEDGSLLYQIQEEELAIKGSAIYAINENAQYYAYASQMEKGIVLGSFQGGETSKIPVNINCITNLILDSSNMELYVTYLDSKVEVYNFGTGELIREYTGLADKAEDVIKFSDDSRTLLKTASNTYLLNENNEIIGEIEGFKAFLETDHIFLIRGASTLYEVPVYSLDKLLDEGKAFLNQEGDR